MKKLAILPASKGYSPFDTQNSFCYNEIEKYSTFLNYDRQRRTFL